MQGRDLRRYAIEAALRILALAIVSLFVHRAIVAFLHDPSRITLLLAAISEGATFAMLLLSRSPTVRDWHPLSVFCTLAASFLYPLLIVTEPGAHLVGERAGATIQATGLLWAIYAKLSLGRSFGLLPAHRGVVVHGAYRWVRHPIYLGYFVTHMGFLLANFGLQNLLVYAILYAIQVFRILREEEILAAQESYRQYCQRVRYRALFGIF
jgi:protein-S-isoprenylcysteine O-methyltransferase Ste14